MSHFVPYTPDPGVYVLRLEDNCYYIGASYNVSERVTEHFDSSGSQWTSRHPPVEVVDVFSYPHSHWGEIRERETQKTVEYMEYHSSEQVRGAQWANPDMSKNPPLPTHLRDDSETDMSTLHSIAEDLC